MMLFLIGKETWESGSMTTDEETAAPPHVGITESRMTNNTFSGKSAITDLIANGFRKVKEQIDLAVDAP